MNSTKEKATLSTLKANQSLRVDKSPLDQQLNSYFSEHNSPKKEVLYKIIIPKDITKELYIYLDALHYSAEQIFPGLYGVVRKMVKDEVNWAAFDQSNIK